jgi:hypothetical protein
MGYNGLLFSSVENLACVLNAGFYIIEVHKHGIALFGALSEELFVHAGLNCLPLNDLILAVVAEASELLIAITHHLGFTVMLGNGKSSALKVSASSSSRALLFDCHFKVLTVAIRDIPSHLISEAGSHVFVLLVKRNSSSGHHTISILSIDSPLDAVGVSTSRACVILSFVEAILLIDRILLECTTSSDTRIRWWHSVRDRYKARTSRFKVIEVTKIMMHITCDSSSVFLDLGFCFLHLGSSLFGSELAGSAPAVNAGSSLAVSTRERKRSNSLLGLA